MSNRCVATLFLSSVLAYAQTDPALPSSADPADPGRFATAIPTGEVFFDAPGDGHLWARGDTYKARFAAGSVSFVPFFGADAPQNFPVTLTLEGVRAGRFELTAASVAQPSRAGRTVSYDRGPLVEQYDLTPSGMEQKFVFASLPDAGDLVVRVALDTELGVAAHAEGFDLSNRWGVVRYGRATVLDATGASLAIATGWDGRAFELTVPSAFLRAAVFPVTIDPFVSTYQTNNGNNAQPQTNPDVACDKTNSRFILVWEVAVSATDHDIYYQLRDYNLPGPGGGGWIDQTTDYWARPRVANNNLADQFLVVAERGLSPALREIWGRTRTAVVPGSTGAAFAIAGADGFDKLNADVGGDPSETGTSYYCVVWERVFSATDRDVHGRLVRTDGTLFGAGTILIDNTGATVDINPVVSKSNGNVPDAQQVWQVVWERRVTATNGDIRGARLTWDGVIASSSFPIVSTADDDLFPTVTSATEMDQSYLVAWQRIPAGPLPSDLMGQVLRGNATVTAVVNLSQLLGLTTNGSEVHPSADSDGCRFAVAYTRTVAPFSETDVATFHLSGGATLGVTDGPAGKHVTSFADANVQIASTRSGGTEWFRYFPVSQSVEMGIAIINGGAYDGRRAGTILTTVPTGCGGLGIATNPSPALGQTFNTSVIGLVGAPVFVLGLPQSPLALCPGCSLGVSLAGALILGAPQFTTVIPCDGVLLGITIAVQFGDYPAPSGCPITGGNVRVTDTVNVTIR